MPNRIQVKVVSQKGHCGAEHTPGQSWVVDRLTPEGLCVSAFSCLIPSLRALRFGGSFPWEEDKDATRVACPDAANPVVFELRRLPG